MAVDLRGAAFEGWTVGELIHWGKSALVLEASGEHGEDAAIKIFDPDLIAEFGPERQEVRLNRELSLRGQSHPHLVSILGGGMKSEDGLFYLIMERLDARNLAEQLATVPRADIWTIVSQVASAAKFLEAQGIAHRDIKPANIAYDPIKKHATLLDLGVLRPIGGQNITDLDRLGWIGTLQYSPPEFLLRQEADNLNEWRSITFYQLGAVLHDLIVRAPLFAEFTDPFARLVEAILHRRPQIVADDVPPDVVHLTQNCLIKQPDVRLKVVSWADFSNDVASQQAPLEAAKKRIAERTIRSSSLDLAPPGIHTTEEIAPILDHAMARVAALARDVCVSSGLLPPISIEVIENRVVIKIDDSVEHELASGLTIVFRIAVLDASSAAIEVAGVAAMGTCSDVSNMEFESVLVGTMEDAVLKKALTEFILVRVDAAQSTNAPVGSQIQVTIPGGMSRE